MELKQAVDIIKKITGGNRYDLVLETEEHGIAVGMPLNSFYPSEQKSYDKLIKRLIPTQAKGLVRWCLTQKKGQMYFMFTLPTDSN